MTAAPRITDDERRRRLAARHAVSPAHRVGTVEEAARAVVGLHATDAPSVYLAAHARVEELTPSTVREVLETERALVKQTGMRNTLFAVPRDLLPAVLGSAAARTAVPEERRLRRALDAVPEVDDTDTWLAGTTRDLLDALAQHGPLSPGRLRECVPALDLRVDVAPGTKWGRPLPAAQYVLSWLCMRGVLVRAGNDGPWSTARPTYASAESWLGERPAPTDSHDGYRELVDRWLRRFGPGTLEDLVWWLGSTKTAARRALGELGAVEVELDDGSHGWVHADDVDDSPDVDDWAALLPTLDPTTMGWRTRGFHLDPRLRRHVYDSVGNGSNTAWWNGRVVGTWGQRDDGTVQVRTLLEVPRAAGTALAREAARLETILDGTRVPITYNSRHLAGDTLP
ncbi:MAG: winged helix DNA-binding domain-containing protein [Nocardioides sp.]|uniref:winged helix DNA-binding domain-containing protein n=1 Tax=Nocardioides sp. TaxID=35761 RepID=UPI003F087BF5